MSDNVSSVLQGIVSDVVSDAVSICNQAMADAAKNAERKIAIESNWLINAYYKSYTPKRYKRTYQLKNAIRPFNKVFPSSTHIHAIIGVEFDTTVLHYHRHVNHGEPIESDWVFYDNFLEGEHPNYLPERGGNGPNYIEKMESFQLKMSDRFGGYILQELIKIISSKFIK